MSLAPLAGALESPREILVKLANPAQLRWDQGNRRTGFPDFDALLDQHPGAITSYALNTAITRHPAFKKYLLLRFVSDADKLNFLAQARRLASVGWAEPHSLLRSNFIPDDSLYNSQWGLPRIGAPAAWDVTRGAATIPIAIIDTGCDLTQPDLIPSFWTNAGEIPDNGVDDDNNGFIDDLHGWDFVDAPSFPSSGDYLERDNDPSDENGHGTALAGICGAAMDNGIGIAGIAPDCPIMVLRAGNLDGYLQEDDVASALLYAADNGARVINMSFGDTQASPMLEDVVNYVAQTGVVLMIAAAGNNSSNQIIFPAAYGAVMCVGACDQADQRAYFSNYGTPLDLLAPGVGIVSTLMDSAYGALQGGNGTSFSTAFASAAAGLVLSLHPEWSASSVISTLKSTCDDVLAPGWDAQSGQGILRADRAVQVEDALVGQITDPIMGQSFADVDTLFIRGTASGASFSEYLVYAGIGQYPSVWDTVAQIRGMQIIDNNLAVLFINEPLDTAYTIRLDVKDIYGHVVDDRIVVYVDPSPPIISNVQIAPILDGERPSYLLTFATDDQTTGKVWMRSITGGVARWLSVTLGYETNNHVVLLGRDLEPALYQYYIWVQNAAGALDSTAILDTLDLQQTSIASNNFVELFPTGIPAGHLFEEALDLDNDGFPEIWEDTLDSYGGISDLRAWEANASWTFVYQGLDFGKQIPKSLGDSDGDGLRELLTLYGGTSRIFEAVSPNGLPQPSHVTWSDSGGVWGVKLLDLVPGDGHGEILVAADSVYQIWKHYPTTSNLELMQTLTNPFNPGLNPQPPHCRVNDFDNDGQIELLFGDYDGYIYIYEQQPSGLFQISWTDSVPLLDAGETLTDGDYDGDGVADFACLAHTPTELAGEHLADTRYWGLFVFKTIGDNQFAPMDTLYIFGAQDPSTFPSGISSGDIYGDSKAEILLCTYPNFYVAGWDAASERFSILWYYPDCRSKKAVVGNFNGSGVNEFLFTGTGLTRVFEAATGAIVPPPPLGFDASPQYTGGTAWIDLNWLPVSGADSYNLYRGASPLALTLLEDDIPDTQRSYQDFDVFLDSTYFYAITTVDGSFSSPESPQTAPISAIPNQPPEVVGDSAVWINPYFVAVDFSEPMDLSLLNVNNYWIIENNEQPRSAASDQGGKRALLTFNPVFAADSSYRLIATNLYDLQGSLLSTVNDTVKFTVSAEEHTLPYLVSAGVAADKITLELLFSQPIIHDDLLNEANYTITADPISGVADVQQIAVQSAEVDSLGPSSTVSLSLNPQTPLGARGRIYRVTANNLFTESGLPIDTTHNTVTLNFFAANLDQAFVFPNPYSPDAGVSYVTFGNLTPNAEIRILTLTGILIKAIKTSENITGGTYWDLRNEHGEPVGSGIYFYFISGDGDTKWGKLAVVR